MKLHSTVIEHYAAIWNGFTSFYCRFCNKRDSTPFGANVHKEYPFRFKGVIVFVADIAVEDSVGNLAGLMEVVDSHPPSGAVAAVQAQLGVPVYYVKAADPLATGALLEAYCSTACLRGKVKGKNRKKQRVREAAANGPKPMEQEVFRLSQRVAELEKHLNESEKELQEAKGLYPQSVLWEHWAKYGGGVRGFGV